MSLQHDDGGMPTTLEYARPVPRRRTRMGVVIPAAAVHFAVVLVVWQFAATRAGLEFDGRQQPNGLDDALQMVLAALRFPLSSILHVPGPEGWLVIAANSVCWGFAFWLVLGLLRRLRRGA